MLEVLGTQCVRQSQPKYNSFWNKISPPQTCFSPNEISLLSFSPQFPHPPWSRDMIHKAKTRNMTNYEN